MAWGRERKAGSVTECGEAVGRAQKGVSTFNTYIPLHLGARLQPESSTRGEMMEERSIRLNWGWVNKSFTSAIPYNQYLIGV